MFDDGFEQRLHVAVAHRRIEAGNPRRADAYTTGKSSCSSVAPNRSNKSKV